jgi:hypothetical protein
MVYHPECTAYCCINNLGDTATAFVIPCTLLCHPEQISSASRKRYAAPFPKGGGEKDERVRFCEQAERSPNLASSSPLR